MWQRVQTLYLLISTALIASMFFSDKAEGIRYIEYVPYLILLIIITLLNVIALTTYRFRILQFRTAILVSLINLAFQAWLAVDYFAESELVFRFTAIFPLVAVILNVLAARGIWADELMVRSAGRLRAAKRKQNNTK
ncbi:MAG: DUF4293 domain-containing protein [Bacteroidales bacterium]|nr:DUF4293 domain-containing protein [Bacteroidales bacterium]